MAGQDYAQDIRCQPEGADELLVLAVACHGCPVFEPGQTTSTIWVRAPLVDRSHTGLFSLDLTAQEGAAAEAYFMSYLISFRDAPCCRGTRTSGQDSLTGTMEADEIRALAGNDTVRGWLNDAPLFGDAGNDTLWGVWGDAGADLLDWAGADLLWAATTRCMAAETITACAADRARIG